MIAQEIAEIWNGILGSLERQLWYIVEDTDEFLPSLRVAISLDERQYDTLPQRSGIRVKRRGLFGISTDQLAYLKTTGKQMQLKVIFKKLDQKRLVVSGSYHCQFRGASSS